MKVRAAVTIRRSQEEIASAWSSTGAAPFVENGQVTRTRSWGPGHKVRVVVEKPVIGGAVGQKVAAAVGSDPQRTSSMTPPLQADPGDRAGGPLRR